MSAITKWECGECGEVHDDEDDARDCCPTPIHEVYECGVCDSFYHNANAAENCCQNVDDSPPAPTAAELEAAGQQRLF